MNLDVLRSKIDQTDNEIVDLLEKRMKFCGEIGKIKKNIHIALTDKNREDVIIKRLTNSTKNIVLKNIIVKIYKLIFQASKQIQNGK